MRRPRHNHGGPWTEQAIEELKALAGEKRSTRDIADTLGRSVEAVQLRARREGVRLGGEGVRLGGEDHPSN